LRAARAGGAAIRPPAAASAMRMGIFIDSGS
jgi:hypothetical protein